MLYILHVLPVEVVASIHTANNVDDVKNINQLDQYSSRSLNEDCHAASLMGMLPREGNVFEHG